MLFGWKHLKVWIHQFSFVFSDRNGADWRTFNHTQDLGMERDIFVIGILIEMSSDRVWSFHSDIIKMFFPSYFKTDVPFFRYTVSCIVVKSVLYTLFVRQLMLLGP